MFNKLLFNNLIISNKKKLKQARVQTINKLVHKLRKLQQQQEKQPENAKIKDRIRKTQECIECSKKAKPHDVVKQILMLEKPPTAIITNDRSTPEEIFHAMLAMTKIMQDLLKNFKEKLDLKEDDPSWKTAILEKSKRREKIERTEEKRKKRKELKEQKSMERKRKEWLEQNKLDDGIPQKDEHVEMQKSTVGEWIVEELSQQNGDLSKVDRSDETELQPEASEGLKTVEPSKKSVKERPLKKLKGKPLKKNVKEKRTKDNKLEKPQELKEIKSFEKTDQSQPKEKSHQPQPKSKAPVKDNDSEKPEKLRNDSNVLNLKNSRVQSKPEKKLEVKTVVDPFFITESGENYVATTIIQPEEPTDTKQNFKKKAFTNDREPFNHKKDFRRTPNDRSNFKESMNSHKTFEVDESLHPSWQAKQKQKALMLNSKPNKKIKFNDDDGEESTSISVSKPTIFLNTKIDNTKLNKEDKDLHPSWLAKQKVKPIIKQFQGKKITFDDDD